MTAATATTPDTALAAPWCKPEAPHVPGCECRPEQPRCDACWRAWQHHVATTPAT